MGSTAPGNANVRLYPCELLYSTAQTTALWWKDLAHRLSASFVLWRGDLASSAPSGRRKCGIEKSFVSPTSGMLRSQLP